MILVPKRLRGALLCSMIATLWGAGCSEEQGPKDSSATHFLVLCDDDDACMGELTCICGVCTRACQAAVDCGGLSAAAVCVSGGSCATAHCDVECSTDLACESLPLARSCEDGHCRGEVGEVGHDGGTGGTVAGGAPSAGGTSAGGTSVGGTSVGGTSVGGANTGGSSAGGTSAGGTSAGGTSSSGGTSAGGATGNGGTSASGGSSSASGGASPGGNDAGSDADASSPGAGGSTSSPDGGSGGNGTGGTQAGGAGSTLDASSDGPSSQPDASVEGGLGADASADAAETGAPTIVTTRLDTLGAAPIALAVDRSDGSSYVLVRPRGAIDLGQGPVGGTFLIKIDPAGDIAWYRGWPDVAGFGGSLAVDPSGRVVLASDYRGSVDLGDGPVGGGGQATQYGVFVVRYTATGAYSFGRTWKGSGDALFQSVALASDGRIVAGGNVVSGILDFGDGSIAAASGGGTGVVLSLTSAGDLEWSRGGTNARVRSVAVEGTGHTVAIGFGHGSASFGGTPVNSAGGTNDILVARLSPAGAQTGLRLHGTSTAQESDVFGTADPAGNVYLSGRLNAPFAFGTGPTLTANTHFVASLRPDGTHRYSFSLQGHTDNQVVDIAVTSTGHAWCSGHYFGSLALGSNQVTSPNGGVGMLFRISGTGAIDSLRSYGQGANDVLYGVVRDGSDHPVVAGLFASGVDFGAGLVTASNSVVVARLTMLGGP